MRRELEKYKQKVSHLQKEVDIKVESLAEEHFKLSRLQVRRVGGDDVVMTSLFRDGFVHSIRS